MDFRKNINGKLNVEWIETPEDVYNKLNLSEACAPVKEYFAKLPKESFNVNTILFLNSDSLVRANIVSYVNVAFEFGYICFARDGLGDAFVFDIETGEVLLFTREGITQDCVTDLNTLEELPVKKSTIRKGVFDSDIFPTFGDFLESDYYKGEF